MATSNSVVVLCPNGRRQKVKVHPNTSLLQVLEDVCRLQRFNPKEYDLKHHRSVLDISSTFRYSNLPNNAMLEMVPAVQAKSESQVTIALQLETGERLMHNFSPSTTLLDIINHWKLQCADKQSVLAAKDSNSVPVCIYMSVNIIGEMKLQETTLRSLGLTKGRAVIRLIHKDPVLLQQQAHVIKPSLDQSTESGKVSEDNIADDDTSVMTVTVKSEREEELKNDSVDQNVSDEQKRTTLQPLDVIQNKTINNVCLTDYAQNLSTDTASTKVVSSSEINEVDFEAVSEKSNTDRQSFMRETDSDDMLTASVKENKIVSQDKPEVLIMPSVSHADINRNHPLTDESLRTQEEDVCIPQGRFVILGERNAVVFNLSEIQGCSYEDLPDDFYNLTIDDVRSLMKDLKTERMKLEEVPLLVKSARELQEDSTTLAKLNKYKYSVIRIQFPDQLVLQGTFRSVESVQAIMDFVREYLEDKQLDFHLFTAPPKTVLQPDARLIEVGCVPAAVLHLGTDVKLDHYLSESARSNISTWSGALQTAEKTRRRETSAFTSNATSNRISPSQVASSSTDKTEKNSVKRPARKSPPVPENKESHKIPKWFKMRK